MPRIAHLIDDSNPGGVTRYLEFLARDPNMAALARHEIVPVPRNAPASVPVEADLIVSHLGISWRSLPGLMALRANHASRPLIHIEHSYSAGFVSHNVTAKRRFFALLRCAYALFDRVVAVSHEQAEWLLLRRLTGENDLSVISPCIDLAQFRALAAPDGPVQTIGAIGRFDRQKGFDMLIRAFCALPGDDLRLRMIGDGPERAQLEELAGDDPRIEFTGFAKDPAAAMRTCDAVAMPSRWEPYGLVALEARAARRPVLVSGVDGLIDQCADGAMRVAAFSEEIWADALRNLVKGHIRQFTEFETAKNAEIETCDGWRQLLSVSLPPAKSPAKPGRQADSSAIG